MQRAKRVADDDARVEPIVADEESRTRGAGPGLVLLLVVFLPVAVAVFSPGLSAPFISDDFLYIVNNLYVREFEPATIPALFDPTGDAIYISGGNYAPIHLLTHAAEWGVFGEAVRGYHLVNVTLHCLNAVLLAALMLTAGVPRSWSAVGAALFLVHPANVEAVVWISQLKSLLALCFALTALLLFRNRPLWAGLPFVLGLLSKASAAFALPFAAVMAWSWFRAGRDPRRHLLSLAFWAVALGLFAIPQLAATAAMGSAFVPEYPDLPSHIRTIFAIAARYFAMVFGYGTAAYHELEPSSIVDPWWWAGLCGGLLLSLRIVWTLRAGREEAAWWIAALAAFAPISQWLPFFFAMADRYLYFILPGLIGGALLFGVAVRESIRWDRLPVRIVAVLCVVVLGGLFATLSVVRSGMWNSDYRLLKDATRRYPNGGTASFTNALIAMKLGDSDEAIEKLREASGRNFYLVRSFEREPLLVPLFEDPRFEALMRDHARRRIELAETNGITSQNQVRGLARVYFLLGEHDRAIELLEASAREGGPLHGQVLYDLVHMRAERAELKRNPSVE